MTFGDLPVYPQRVLVDGPAEPSLSWPPSSRRFPGWPGPVLVLSDENQGVCSWGVPLGGSGDQVVVGGDLLDAGRATVPYAASVKDFIAARRWDHRCLSAAVLLQAQAAELDQASLGYLQARLRRSRRQAGPGRGNTGLKTRTCRSCSGRMPASATGGSRPQVRGPSGRSPPDCWTWPIFAAHCGLTTASAPGCSTSCAGHPAEGGRTCRHGLWEQRSRAAHQAPHIK